MTLFKCHALRPGRTDRRRRMLGLQTLEHRNLLAVLPYGAAPEDTGEFMLGEVLVTVVLLESDGRLDANREDWRPDQVEQVKENIREGMQWWEDLLDEQNSVHSLDFRFDWTYADRPIATSYEPISRPSDDFELWIEDFFAEVGVDQVGSFSDRIRQFNHAQRIAHATHWAFTLFVVNAQQDPDHRFAADGSFSQSFAFAGGRFFVTTSERPASSIAHETAHMFWAMDEYPGGKTYYDQRGYYNTQNLNGFDGHPNPETRTRSLMDSTVLGYTLREVSSSALETIGWRDSDRDGIFDVLDVAHSLTGAGQFDPVTREYDFDGFTRVQTLPNLNSSGTGHAITLNRIDRVEVRYDGSDWQAVLPIDDYEATVQFQLIVPPGIAQIEIRTMDARSGVSSNILTDTLEVPSDGWQNLVEPADVNADTLVTPLDALLIINRLNAVGSGPLDPVSGPPPFLDVNGDGFLSPVDALVVINRLNTPTPPLDESMAAAAGAEGERPGLRSFGWVAADRGVLPPMKFGDRLSNRFRERACGEGLAPPCNGGQPPRDASCGLAHFDRDEQERFGGRTLAHRGKLVDVALMDLLSTGGKQEPSTDHRVMVRGELGLE